MKVSLMDDSEYKIVELSATNAELGAYVESELTNYIVAGIVQKTTMVWLQGMPSWMPAEQVMDVNKLFGLIPPPIK